MDWDKASQELAKDLDRKRDDEQIVKTRQGGGGKELSYIEGWWAIAEANRIFGHGGWSRATTELKLITEKPVGYFAKVRVTVGDIVRDGCGWGSDVRGDHEKALKEAETDATKRALMTFGWPFGLALYDKTQEHVSDGEQPNYKPPTISPKEFPTKPDDWSAAKSKPALAVLIDAMKRNKTPAGLNKWWFDNKATIYKSMNNEFFWRFYIDVIERGADISKSKLELDLFWSMHADKGLPALEEANREQHDAVIEYMLTKATNLNAGLVDAES